MADRKAYNIYEPVITNGHARMGAILGGAISIVAADLDTNDTVGLFKVAKGFTLISTSGKVTDMDTGGSPALLFTIGCTDSVGADPDRFLTSSNAGQAGGVLAAIPATGVGYKFDADTEIVLTVATGAATAAAGTLTFYMHGFFDMG